MIYNDFLIDCDRKIDILIEGVLYPISVSQSEPLLLSTIGRSIVQQIYRRLRRISARTVSRTTGADLA